MSRSLPEQVVLGGHRRLLVAHHSAHDTPQIGADDMP